MKLSKLLPRSKSDRELPILPLKDMVIFPHSVVSLLVDAHSHVNHVLNLAGSFRKNELLYVYQKSKAESPASDEIYDIGTLIQIVHIIKLPDGNKRVIVKGIERVTLKKIVQKNHFLWAEYNLLPLILEQKQKTLSLIRSIKEDFRKYTILYGNQIPKDTVDNVFDTEDAARIIGIIAGVIDINHNQKIQLFIENSVFNQLKELSVILRIENELLEMRTKITLKTKEKMIRTQREYFLQEQLKEINRELGGKEEDPSGACELKQKIESLQLPDDVKKKSLDEVKRLSFLQAMTPESAVLRTYLEWIISLPWNQRTNDQKDLALASKILDSDHFGLAKPKERILDFIAVEQLKPGSRGPILCFTGPPGTGKTSLGRSLAKALGRKFVRFSLGGIRDESEIRGHRKTYVGALPGKIIQSIKRADSMNPVFLLDEVDKISPNGRGDPASALLEVLDPEQNNSFTDHYLEIPFDLSEVIFITTANNTNAIPVALLDRMEIIRISGYTILEKKTIAKQFIIPKQTRENGLKDYNIHFSDQCLDSLIRGYTLEAGLRNLERCISKVMRKIARKIVSTNKNTPEASTEYASDPSIEEESKVLFEKEINPNNKLEYYDNSDIARIPAINGTNVEIAAKELGLYLGKKRLEDDFATRGRPGLTPALYYDGGGGGALPVEARIFAGSGKLLLTGQLGNVMKESAQIALSFLKANKQTFGLTDNFGEKADIHIHVPQGATPVDGPSAGIALTAALLSCAMQVAIKDGIAVTGEITLTDRILPVGGIIEKSLAARRLGFENIMLPEGNRRDTEEFPSEIQKNLNFIFHNDLRSALIDLFPEFTFEQKPEGN